MKAKHFWDGVVFGQDCSVTVQTRVMEASFSYWLSRCWIAQVL